MATAGEDSRQGSSGQRSPAKKSAAKKSSPSGSSNNSQTTKYPVAQVASRAAEQLGALAGRNVESVTGLERQDDGWTVHVEVVEARRIPDSADILALYEVRVDGDAELTEYRRVRRYPRGRSGDE
ncbi:MAG: gas vesicle protein GvpO [Nocardioidaceae bacterium]